MNPGHGHLVFDTRSALAFVQEHHRPPVVEAFRRARHPAQRADLFRLAYLSIKGGVYVDADDKCLEPLDSFIPPGADLVLYQENYGTIANNFIAVQPGHPVILAALDQAVTALNRGDHDTIWLCTGPGLMTRAMAQALADDTSGELLARTAVLELWQIQRVIGLHCPARYKATRAHWSRTTNRGGPERRRAK
jgi:mannosyltransferase OCH1-like enzyme